MRIDIPFQPKIYHILHINKLPFVLAEGGLLCDAEISRKTLNGTTIGMSKIKKRRLNLPLASHTNLFVGDCVPFYFCPRSVMLYMFHKNNHENIDYKGGQQPIIHLELDLYLTIQWANHNEKRWAFTLSNAGSYYFEDRASISQLSEINWIAVQSRSWFNCRDEKQSEFLLEKFLPWELVQNIGVYSSIQETEVKNIIKEIQYTPSVEIRQDWYY